MGILINKHPKYKRSKINKSRIYKKLKKVKENMIDVSYEFFLEEYKIEHLQDLDRIETLFLSISNDIATQIVEMKRKKDEILEKLKDDYNE